jgi:hypothetical protein
MSSNVRRYTPGILLAAWALVFSTIVLFSWRIYLHQQSFEWTEFPTALGDTHYYKLPLCENDYYFPALKFSRAKEGLYRQSVNPIPKADRLMNRVEKEKLRDYAVYEEALRPQSGRYFLKVGQDQYIAFGQRQHWPPYRVPKAQQVQIPRP